MRYASRKASSLWPSVLIGSATFVLAAFGVVGTVGVLWAMGKIDLPFLHREPSHEGLVGVPLSAMATPRYTKITRDHVFNHKTGTWSIIYMRPDRVLPGVLTETKQIFGRVLNHDKPAGYVFTESDFYPKGTEPGVVAGIPPGKRALTLDPEKLHGIRSLQVGDHVDILSALPVDDHRRTASLGILPGDPTYTDSVKHAAVKVVVQNGVIVSGVTTRLVPVSSTGLTSGLQTRTRPIQEVVIAVDPKEAGPLQEALAVNAELQVIARSGRPEDPGAASVTPDLTPSTTRTVVQTWVGSKRQTQVFVKRPTPAPPPTPPTEPKKVASDSGKDATNIE